MTCLEDLKSLSEQYDNCIVSDRGGVIENTHRVHAAVVDANGRLLYSIGNPSRTTLARSAEKPTQILALLETKGFDQFQFDDADLALMCSSHSSEERHINRGRNMLAKLGAEEQDLRCGGHPAMSEAVNNDWIKKGYEPTALCNNCSAKHVGMLAGAYALGGNTTEYHSPDHPIQLQVRKVVQEVSQLSESQVKWGIDGCNLPAPALPLNSIALTYAVLAKAADVVQNDASLVSSRMQHLARIYHSMWKYPEMVAGEGRFCTELMQKYQGILVGKLGADGCYGVAIRASEHARHLGAGGAIGIAVKIEDGDTEVLYAAVMEILEQLQIGTAETRMSLQKFHCPMRINTAGVITGELACVFKLRKA